MTISSIQKKKFLDTVYKNFFAAGYKPTEKDLLDLFSKYFSNYEPGSAIPLRPELFRSTAYSNVDLMNERMAHSLLNIENLYDSIFENSEQMFDVINALNNRIDNLKKRRAELESKIDDHIYSNQNSDGFYASITDNFSNGKNIDYNLSSIYLDTINKKVTLPKLNSAVFDMLSTNIVTSNSPRYTLSYNRQLVDSNKPFDDSSFFGSVFDGLSNTEWHQVFDFNEIGLVTLSINIPISNTTSVSKIEGRLNTVSPTDIYAKINYSNGTSSEVKSKKSTFDYDTFSFDFKSGAVSSIDLVLLKVDPDYVDATSAKKYKYRFGIRDINISGQYYDKSGSLITEPISLATSDNKNLIIDAVTLTAEETNAENGSITYYIAEDKGNEVSILDYNWIPIAKPFDVNSSFSSTVNLKGSNVNTLRILDSVTDERKDVAKIPLALSTQTSNINEENPTQSIYSGIPIYRIARIPQFDSPYSPYILEGVNYVTGNYVTYSGNIYNEVNGLTTWNSILNGLDRRRSYTLPPFEISSNSSFFEGPNLSNVSIILDFKLYCANDIVASHRFVKDDQTSQAWNVGIYINDTAHSIPSGKDYDTIEWRFQKGINRIKVTIDAIGSAKGSISLMDTYSILNYGVVYSQYYTYVDPLELRFNRSSTDNVFTIDSVFGNKEILSKKNIKSNSRIFYFTNSPTAVGKIRLRADFSRGANPLETPVLNSYKIKFKNSQTFAETTSTLLQNNASSTTT
jgi:hypothetical protein